MLRRLILLLSVGLLPLGLLAQSAKPRRIDTQYEKGTLTNGRPSGLWQYFDSRGQLDLSIDYDSSRVVFVRPDTARYRLRVGTEWREARHGRAPRFLGSLPTLMQYLGMHMRYPGAALRDRQQGTVVIGFTVNTQGQATDFAVEQSVSAACDEHALQVLQAAPNRWLPAVHLGRPTEARFRLLVHFTLAGRGESGQDVARRVGSPARRPDELEVLVTAYAPR
ncbi:hypothetical protein GCM10027048_40770 [Hymenobacter coalescens]